MSARLTMRHSSQRRRMRLRFKPTSTRCSSGTSGSARGWRSAAWAGGPRGSSSLWCCSAEASLVTAVKTRHALWCCVSLVPRPTTGPTEGRSRPDNEVLDAPGVGVGGQPEEQSRGTRDQPRHHRAAARRRWRAQERRALWFSQCSPSRLCQSVFMLLDFRRSAVRWVSGWSEGGRLRCCVVSVLLVPWCVLLSFPFLKCNLIAAAVRKRRRRLQWAPEAIERRRCSWCT